jgi:hypothetical protein
MLLCDGCDEGRHMGCLQPKLTTRPAGHWLCPKCCPAEFGSAWIALHDVPKSMGGLCVVPTSHQKLDDPITPYRDDPEVPDAYLRQGKQLPWHVADYKAGDVVIFDLRLIHAAGVNNTSTLRLSVEARWAIYPQWPSTRLTRLLKSWGNNKPADKIPARPATQLSRGKKHRGIAK